MQPEETTPALPPPPPAPPSQGPRATGPAALAALCVLVWAICAAVAFRHLWPYPPRYAAAILALVAVPIAVLGFLAGHLASTRARMWSLLGTVALCVVLAFGMTTSVPGVAQPDEHPIPGAPAVAVCAAPDGTWDLYLMPRGDAAGLITLTDTSTPDECWPSLSPDRSRLAYSVENPDGSADVFLMQLGPDGHVGSRVRLLSGGTRELSVSAWTPDGDLLVQSSDARGRWKVVLVNISSGAQTLFLRGAASVSYSPDGSQIVYSAPGTEGARNWDIWTANADGSHARDVADSGGPDYGPSWSPDGSTLAFTSDAHGDTDVYTARSSGGGVIDLTASSRDRDASMEWTPDGHILFTSNRSHTGGTFLYTMDADGQNVQLALRI